MIHITDYIQLLLKKKKWTLQRFADEINLVKKQVGIDSITTKQNISNYLNNHVLSPKTLCLWEKALDLPTGTLMNMVEPPLTKEGKKELKDLMKRVGDIK